MNKDVIYIDVEDDITAIIGKVKGSSERVVALVPPKRIGVLQSAVNLHLLARAANNADKRLVIITNSIPLAGLAAASKIPVAKNLQTKPELAEIPVLSVDDGEDIIDGKQLSVGELARTADLLPGDTQSGIPVHSYSGDNARTAQLGSAALTSGDLTRRIKKSAGSKVPDFNKFRKKLVIFGGLGVLLLAFLIWAIAFAPRATIVIAARTSVANVSGRVNSGTDQTTDFSKRTIRTVSKETKKSVTVDFTATGTEERGEKASGTMTLTQSTESSYVDVPAGSEFSSGNLVFVTTEYVRVPGATLSGGNIVPGSANVAVSATAIGSEYNLPAQSYVSSVDTITARGGQMTGGSKQIVKIVTAEDVQKASEQLTSDSNTEIKKTLNDMFDDSFHVIDSSFVANIASPQPTPAIGAVSSDGKAKLTSQATYTMTGIAKTELNTYLTQALESQITKPDQQQISNTGQDSVKLSEFIANETTGGSVIITTSGQLGPKIDETQIKEDSKGKSYGEVQGAIEAISGIDSVDVKFWPFWVRTVPGNTDRISVEFKLESN